MKNRWLFAVLVLMAAMLSCQYLLRPDDSDSLEPYTDVQGVAISPPSGSGDFQLTVNYSVFANDTGGPGISCYYITPSGMTMYIGKVSPVPEVSELQLFTGLSDTFKFSVRQADGKIEPGSYTAGCLCENHKKDVQTSFTVIESPATATPTPSPANRPKATPTQSPTPQQTPISTATSQPQLTNFRGKIIFDYAKYESSRPGAGGEAYQVTNLCIPEITVSTDGALSGSCEKNNTAGHLVTSASITVSVTGKINPAGQVVFSYDVSEIGAPNGSWRVSYEGQGVMTSMTQAAGVATFTYSCASGADNLLWCGSQPSEDFSGTLPWTLVSSQ